MRPPRFRALVGSLVLAAVATIGFATAFAPAASAHASLQTTDPTDGSRVDIAPKKVTLIFDEPVTVEKAGVRVVGTDGTRVDLGDARTEADGSIITVTLGSLKDDTYVVSWRAVSEDSHPVGGAFTFDLGSGPSKRDAALAAAQRGVSNGPWPRIGDAARALSYLGLLIAAGWAIFRFVIDPRRADEMSRRNNLLFSAAVMVGMLGSAATIFVQAVLISGRGISALGHANLIADATGNGLGWGVLLAAEGAVAILVAWWWAHQAWARPVAIVGAGVVCYSFSVAGHSISSNPKVLYMALDTVHAAAAAIWLGGIVGLLVAAAHRERADDNEGVALLAQRYSNLATGSIAVLGAAGIAMAWNEVRSLSNLTGTSYGKALIVKVGLVAVALLFGARNHFVIVPALRKGVQKAVRALSTALIIEVAAIALAGVTTGVLVNLVPAKVSASPGLSSSTVAFGQERVNVTIDPPRVGTSLIHVYFQDASGKAVDTIDGPEISFALPSANIAGIVRGMTKAGPGHFQMNNAPFTQAGNWVLTLIGYENRFTEVRVDIPVTIK